MRKLSTPKTLTMSPKSHVLLPSPNYTHCQAPLLLFDCSYARSRSEHFSAASLAINFFSKMTIPSISLVSWSMTLLIFLTSLPFYHCYSKSPSPPSSPSCSSPSYPSLPLDTPPRLLLEQYSPSSSRPARPLETLSILQTLSLYPVAIDSKEYASLPLVFTPNVVLSTRLLSASSTAFLMYSGL